MNRLTIKIGLLSAIFLLVVSGINSLTPVMAQSGTPAATTQDITFPHLTGPYNVGRTSFEWIDQSRDEIYASVPGFKRDLMVYVWFPATLGKHKRPAPYMDGGITWDVVTRQLGLEGTIHTYAYISSIVDPDKPSYPVLVFVHGSHGMSFVYSSILEELASHGYIVIATSHPYNTATIAYPDGRLLIAGSVDAGQNLTPNSLKIWTDDVRFVLDQAAKLNETDETFKGRLDLANIGIFGHSFGGETAIATVATDPRVKAGAGLDAGGLSSADIPDVGNKPFLYIGNLPSVPQQIQDKYLANIRGTAHLNYGDFGLLLPVIQVINGVYFDALLGPIDPTRGVHIVNSYLLTFFDHYLKGTELKWPSYDEAKLSTP